jgi:hypothetical protein
MMRIGIPSAVFEKDEETQYRTYLHTMGHVLGFERHTRNSGLMSDPPGSSKIGELEKTMIKYLYSLDSLSLYTVGIGWIGLEELSLIGYD